MLFYQNNNNNNNNNNNDNNDAQLQSHFIAESIKK